MSNRQHASLINLRNKPLTTTPPASRFQTYCEGYFAADSPQYMLGVSVKAAAVKRTKKNKAALLSQGRKF